jgi:hypothetical protein
MRHALVVLSLFGGLIALSATEASAVVCARGIYRAGCVGPYGAVGVRRGVYGRHVVGVHRGHYGRRAVGFRRW